MTQERFHRLLDNPDLLTTIPYEEMKTLALAYPYAHNLRYMLALKARQDEHPDADRMLTTAAVYSLDRTKLFHLTVVKVAVLQPVAMAMQEAVLELKSIEIVQRELEALAPQSRAEFTEKSTAQEVKPIPPAGNSTPDSSSPTPTSEAPETTWSPAPPAPAQPFALWIGSFNPPVLVSKTPPPPELPHIPEQELPSPALSAQELAERSVSENKGVISETLARLLVKQGYRDKAINMYERLRLAFPEKSAYFAAEIEKLKK